MKHCLVAAAAGIFIGAALFDVFPFVAGALVEKRFAVMWMVFGVALWLLQKLALQALRRPALPMLIATALWFHSILEGILVGLSFGVSQVTGILVAVGMALHLLPEFFAAMALMRGAGSRVTAAALTPFVGYAVLLGSFGVTAIMLPQLGDIFPRALALSGGAFLFVGGASYGNHHRGVPTLLAFGGGATLAFFTAFLV